MIAALRKYLSEVRNTLASGKATEHSYRPAFKTLVEAIGGDGAQAINEPTHGEYGAPDFIVERSGVPIGHIECKDIGQNLDAIEESEQLKRYRDALPNLILTDYVEFRWYVDGVRRDIARLARSGDSQLAAAPNGSFTVAALFESFFGSDASEIGDASDLARRMAGKTRLLRDHIRGILAEDDEEVASLRGLLGSYREVLISDLGVAEFADLQAQTVAYGLFAARYLHDGSPASFTRQSAVFAQTTPFLRDVFGRVAGPSADPRIAWIVDDLARLLGRANMAAILENFGKRTKQEDPVVHFYEDFLAAYDPKLREQRGVYYTPEPVVSYIVRSVDHLLRDEFELAHGLADTSTIEVEDAEGVKGKSPRVLILDPAAGTGSFLREAVSTVREDIESRGLAGGWADYVREHLLPRLFGFELLMAPYAIAHLKLAIEIGGDPRQFMMPSNDRLNIFLTNSLEEAHEALSKPLFAGEIAREAREADAVKRARPVMVVLGNPPYSGHSANKGKWIKDLVAEYKRGIPELKKPGQAKWLSDDYVKFIRFAQWRIERTGEGVLGFVTNHSYLDNPTFRGMRHSLMTTFNEMWLLDLHGNSKRRERAPGGGVDQNVFDIQQGVAIAIFVKRAGGRDGLASVFHADLWGERAAGTNGGKYGWLASNNLGSTDWNELVPRAPHYLFVPRDEKLSDEYEAAWSVPAIFAPNGDPAPGIVTTHDQFAISWNAEEARSKVKRLLATDSEAEAREIWRLCSQNQWQYQRAKEELAHGEWLGRVEDVHYRPFDIRATVFDRNVAVHRRERVMLHMLAGPNLGLISCRQQSQQGVWAHCGVTREMIESCAISNKTREINYLFPLYIYPQAQEDGEAEMKLDVSARRPNLSKDFMDELSSAVALGLTLDHEGDLEGTFGPADVFHYIYAVLHSPAYRRRYADFLKSDFPRVPVTSRRALFAQLVRLGRRLAMLHLMEATGELMPAFSASGGNRVDRVRHTPAADGIPGRVWINKTQHFEGVSLETWEFTIGGYRPAEKWLKDRKGRKLSFDDISWYQRVCAALAETPRLMAKIDEAISAQGGWPLGQPRTDPAPVAR